MPRDREAAFEIGGHSVEPGGRVRFDLPAALLPTHTQLHLPITVVHGRKAGPRLWVSAAVHGDEINGVEIIRQVIDGLSDPMLAGTLVAVPVVNVFGFIGQSRYFPDRRDLNRSFPGSRTGPLASRIAHLFLTEIVSRCTHGIDLHTASRDRFNLAQVRGNLLDPETKRLAVAFRAPAMMQSAIRDGSLRAAASHLGIPNVVFEGGEAMRFNDGVIRIGVRGIRGVMRDLGMLPRRADSSPLPIHITKSRWVRARRGGILRLLVDAGQTVEARQMVGQISDPFGGDTVSLQAPFRGVVLGKTDNPIVHGGDAIINVGRLDDEPREA